MRTQLPPCEQLAVDVAELLHRITVATDVDTAGQPIRRHVVDSPGLLRLARNPRVLAPGRTGDSAGGAGFGSRPPARLGLIALDAMIRDEALGLLETWAPDTRAPRSAAAALHALTHVAAVNPAAAKDIASAVASLADTARIGLGFLAPPLEVPLRCLYCWERLVCPQTEGGRYLLCRNRHCRCGTEHCEGRGRRHRWDESELGLVIAENQRRTAVAVA